MTPLRQRMINDMDRSRTRQQHYGFLPAFRHPTRPALSPQPRPDLRPRSPGLPPVPSPAPRVVLERWTPSGSRNPVRKFGSFTSDLGALAQWLWACGVKQVAMESTSVYWIPMFECLDRAGFDVMLVPPRMTKQISGRKSDVLDCQWIRQLLSYGLLRGSYRPDDGLCPLRSLGASVQASDRGPLAQRVARAKGVVGDECAARFSDQ